MTIKRILRIAVCVTVLIMLSSTSFAQDTIKIGVAETDINPPVGFPMAGYYHERLAEGTIDSLKAKCIVFRGETQQAAIVICDLTGIAVDFSTEVRRLASEKTGIPAKYIVVSATHSHTAPDYTKALYDFQGDRTGDEQRQKYVKLLINNTVEAVVKASNVAAPAQLESGWAEQKTPVAFNRRFVQRDGSVRTWVGLEYPGSLRSAGPIDPEIGMLLVKGTIGKVRGLFSSFALHLDTVGGLKWSGDYPYFIEQAVHNSTGPGVVSLFGTGCCGDVNHVNPRGKERNKTDFIGGSLGETVVSGLSQLEVIQNPHLEVRSAIVPLPLQDVTADEVAEAIATVKAVQAGEKVEFLDHVAAHKRLMLDELRNSPRIAAAEDSQLARRRTHRWAGVGAELPVDINVICIGDDIAIVCLPGEVFVDLGLAIKRGSPFRTTIIMELSNCVETCYIPTRAAYAGGSYEVTNSTLKPGAGEMLVEESLRLLRAAAGRK
ncbi:MAG: hypothetical protein O2856_05440 [Planctomycetota bacterium]|nr:hypothetical protein [Planctomycetota bacterium]